MTSVSQVYERIADSFDKTRHTQWRCVKRFLDSLPTKSLVADIGCGNGKNIIYRNDLNFIGTDITCNLINIAKQKSPKTDFFQGNGLSLPFKENMFDAAICIAVIHHINNIQDRERFLGNVLKCVKKDGVALITLWASEQPKKDSWKNTGGGDFFVPWKGEVDRYYHFFTKEEVENLIASQYDICDVIEMSEEYFNHCFVLKKK